MFQPADPPSHSPTLQLAVRVHGADAFGTLEWILATARRTGLSLQQLRYEAGPLARMSVQAPDADLLHLFVNRVSQAIDLAIVDAEVSEPEPLAA